MKSNLIVLFCGYLNKNTTYRVAFGLCNLLSLKRQVFNVKKKSLPSMCRFDFLSLPKGTVKTFSRDIYEVKSGLLVRNVHTNKVYKLQDIFYDIRTVKDAKGNIVAKRKNPQRELCIINNT